MKTIKLLFIGLAVLSMGLFTSCEEDGETTGPSIKFVTGTGVTTDDATVAAYSEVKFSCLVAKGSADLVSFDIKEDNVTIGGDYPINSADADIFDKASFTANATVVVAGPGTYTYTFIATDEDGLTDIQTIVITAGTNINSYTDKILGSYSASQGSSFASVDGSIMTSSQASANSAKVDFVYWYGASALATLSAPSTPDALDIYPGIANWTTKNETLMASTILNASQFDAIDSDTEILTAADALTTVKIVNGLAVGDVLVFQTAATSANASKKGLIKVTAITGTGGTGTIEIEVKVQK